jgi:hypothetical protein
MANYQCLDDHAMRERAVRALRMTWHTIEYQVFLSHSSYERRVGQVVLTGAEVIDGVTSAGFVEGLPFLYGGDPEAVGWLDMQSETAQHSVCREAFPNESYTY